tara:strand:- start:120 stop:293 length:174 start_codon:yes stop_codon:yes gene_type:complete
MRYRSNEIPITAKMDGESDDLWPIPKTIFNIRDDYNLYLHHYTEGVTETVMFFIPRP